jgi:DNA polymerase
MSVSEIEKLLTNVQIFLKQEKQLYGNTFYTEPRTTVVQEVVIEESHSQQNENIVAKKIVKKEIPAASSESIAEEWQNSDSLKILNEQICECQKCALGKTRTKFVFGVGNPNADVLVIGEAPGADEDAQGEPFVGRAGQLLNKILEAVQFKREEVYIANILKCRPPNNRKPTPEEAELCEPYLWKQIELIQPKFILCLGLTAAQTLLRTTESMTQLRQSIHRYRETPVIVTYHPAALLRNPNWKRPTWEDVQKLRKMYEESKSNS